MYKETNSTIILASLSSFFFLMNCIEDPGHVESHIQPNIIFILADDMGYGDVEILNSNSKIATPSINKLAEEGITFTNAHAPASVCTPTRYSFLTGRYPWRSKMKSGVSWIWEAPLIERDRFTIGEMLQREGYYTACIGKWHLGWNWPTTDGIPAVVDNGKNVDYSLPIKNGPTTLGFNYYFGDDVPSFPPHAFIKNDRVVTMPTAWLEPGKAGAPGAMTPGWTYENLMPTISTKAIKFIEERTLNSPDQPFFLFFSLSAPHTPIAPNESFLGSSEAGRYGDFVGEMDHYIGKLLRTVDSLGISENTLIIFTSDNGPTNMDGENYTGEVGSILEYGHNSSGILRGLKSDSWEAGHRVPFIAKWPGRIPKNTKSNSLISLSDMMSTFAEITEYQLPDSVAEDSYSILPLLSGKEERVRKDLIVQSGNGILSLIDGDWKLIMSSGGGGMWSKKGELPKFDPNSNRWINVQLYDLDSDLEETTNLCDQYPEQVESMVTLLTEYILNGRSTEGDPLSNDGKKRWESVRWIQELEDS